MEYRKIGDNYYIRMDRGDEIISNLLEICEKESIPSAVFSGISGCQSAELQVFIPERLRVGEQSSGMTGVLRFNEMRCLMTDCSQKMLSQTLKNLEQSHLVHRKVYPEVPPRVEYSLTDIGKSLMPTLTALIAWGKEHFSDVVTD